MGAVKRSFTAAIIVVLNPNAAQGDPVTLNLGGTFGPGGLDKAAVASNLGTPLAPGHRHSLTHRTEIAICFSPSG